MSELCDAPRLSPLAAIAAQRVGEFMHSPYGDFVPEPLTAGQWKTRRESARFRPKARRADGLGYAPSCAAGRRSSEIYLFGDGGSAFR